MFPVAEVGAEPLAEDFVASVVGVEVEVEGVEGGVVLFVEDDGCGTCVVGFAGRGGLDAVRPWWVCCPIIVGCEPDFAVVVKLVEVGEGERVWRVFYCGTVGDWMGIG